MMADAGAGAAGERIEGFYRNRSARARELKAGGKKVVGYFCCVPVELFTAASLVPYRIQGNIREAITRADTYMETICCPFARSCFDRGLKGDYAFLDGLVVPHSCDTVQRLYDIWKAYCPTAYMHFLDVPHFVRPASFEFFEQELGQFKKSLEKLTGTTISDEHLQEAIRLHNQSRALLRELYELRKAPLISGTEVQKILVARMCLPVAEFNELLREVVSEVRARKPLPPLPRILVYGTEIDDIAFIELIENGGGWVVMDDICTGTRSFWHDVGTAGAPLAALAAYYLGDIPCPRTYRPPQPTYEADIENRFGYILDYVREFNVQGVIAYTIRYCDTQELDVPSLKDYLEGNGVPVLPLEDEYNSFTMGQLRTRIQAFLETLL